MTKARRQASRLSLPAPGCLPGRVDGQIAVPTRLFDGPPVGPASTSMTMTTVPVVHEYVHQWARRQEEPWKIRDDMGPVLRYKKERRDDRKQHENLRHTPVRRSFGVSASFVHGQLPANDDTVAW